MFALIIGIGLGIIILYFILIPLIRKLLQIIFSATASILSILIGLVIIVAAILICIAFPLALIPIAVLFIYLGRRKENTCIQLNQEKE